MISDLFFLLHQILKDELATLQLELIQREDQLKEYKEKSKKLESENSDLVDRWILSKQQEAAKMNEANDFVETYVAIHNIIWFPSRN